MTKENTVTFMPGTKDEVTMTEKQFKNLPKIFQDVSEVTVKDQVLKDIGELIQDLITKITENVDETQESASFTIKCVLDTDKEGNHNFEISGKTTLNTPTIIRGARIVGKQLSLYGI